MPLIRVVSESSCMVSLGAIIDPAISAQVAATTALIREQLGSALIDIVPSYCSILLNLNINRLSVEDCCVKLEHLLSGSNNISPPPQPSCTIEIPVCYDEELAPDLNWVGEQIGLSNQDIIQLHSQTTYRVYAIGFAPGFCFLGTLDERLALPRKATPRPRVQAGSVAIAEQQTAIYPRPTPGGWHVIGRTHCDMLALCNASDNPLQVGDQLRFVPQTLAAYHAQCASLR